MKVEVGNTLDLNLLGHQKNKKVEFEFTQWTNKNPIKHTRSYKSPDSFYVSFRDSIITSFPPVIIVPNEGKVYFHEISAFSGGRKTDQFFWGKLDIDIGQKSEINFEKNIKEVDYPVIGFFNNGNMFHWLCEAVPRLKFIEDYNIPGKIITQRLNQFQRESLEFFPKLQERIVELDVPVAIKSPEIYMISVPSLPLGKISDWVLPYLRSKYVLDDQIKSTDNVYISRNDAMGRKLLNENKLIPLLEKYNFKIINLSEYPFAKKVEIFQKAKLVAGPHGSGLINSMWCNPGTTVLEIMFPNLINHVWFSCPGSQNKLNYNLVTGVAKGPVLPERNNKAKNRDFIIDLDEFKYVLEELL